MVRGASFADDASAAEAEGRAGHVIEEIVVTAQKREQGLREVPVSMSVIDGDFIERQDIGDLSDLSKFTPNVRIDLGSSVLSTNVRIRGFGAADSYDIFEQPVGMAIDGDSYSKLPPFMNGLFDVERVEVLKGPQGTLYGKNTTAGLVNVTTRDPTDEFTGFADARFGMYDARRFEGALGGPLLPGVVNFRIAGLSDEEDGYVRNTGRQIHPAVGQAPYAASSRRARGIRLKLGFPDLFGVRLDLSHELAEAEYLGSTIELRLLNQGKGSRASAENLLRKYEPDVDLEFGNRVTTLDTRQDAVTRTRRFIAEANYDVGGWGLTGLVGISAFDKVLHIDADVSPIPLCGCVSGRTEEQANFELRLLSPSLGGFLGLDRILSVSLGKSDLAIGFFYQRREIPDSFAVVRLDAEGLGDFSTYLTTGEFPPVPPGSGRSRPRRVVSFNELASGKTHSLAPFGQLTWRLAKRWTVEGGGRFTRATDDGFFDNSTGGSPEDEALFVQGLGYGVGPNAVEHSSSAFTSKVAVIHDWTDEISFFAARATSFKAGGLVVPSVYYRPEAIGYEPEFGKSWDVYYRPEAIGYEPEFGKSWDVGTKARLFGGTAMVNATLYWMNIVGLQVFQSIGGNIAGVNTGPVGGKTLIANAGEARTRGAELDATWLPTEWSSVYGGLSFNDSKYLDHKFGSCSLDSTNTDGDENDACDLTGKPFPFAPQWTAVLSPNVRFPVVSVPGGMFSARGLFGSVDVFGGVTVIYNDVNVPDHSLDPRVREPAFVKLDANLGIGDPSSGWSLRIDVQNVTNEVTSNFRRVLFPYVSGDEVAPLRGISGAFRWEF